MKRLCTLLVTVAVLAGAAVAMLYFWHTGFNSKKYTFDLIVKEADMDFWRSVNQGAQAAASTYNVNVSMIGPAIEKDYSQQVSLLESSIARKPDAIILAAADYNLLAKPVQEAIDKGIPVIMVDSDVDNSHTVAYVGTDNVNLGTQLAKQMQKRLDQTSGEVGIVSFVKESYPAVQRESGFRSILSTDRRFTLLDTAYGDSDVQKTEYQTAVMVAQHPKLAAIASLNAQSSEGAAQALSKLGRKDIPLFAIDCTPEEAMYMEDGILKLAILQNPYQMGYYGVETACRRLKGEKVNNRYTDIYSVDITTLFSDRYQQLVFPFNS